MSRSTGAGRHPPSRRTHGASFVNGKATPEYNAWHSMKARCGNPNHKSWADYGGRGLRVCPEWVSSFEAFLTDMGLKPFPNASLERIDNNRGYGPDNCMWATPHEQARNTRKVRTIVLCGEAMCLTDACVKLGISRATGTRWVKAGKIGAAP
jgi:hypothetical protein